MRTLLGVFFLQAIVFGQPSGRDIYQTRCAGCHGADARGGEHGPALGNRVAARSDVELTGVIHTGFPSAGMPGTNLNPADTAALIQYLRSIRAETESARIQSIELGQRKLEGAVVGESASELQLRTAEPKIHLLRRTDSGYREVTSETGWPTYHGSYSGNRYSALEQINTRNVSKLAPAWMFAIPNTTQAEVTPIVVDGVMYVTAANECSALDAGSGRLLWRYRRSRTPGVIGDAGGGINRGVAVSGGRLFLVTDHAHLIALNRFTGALLWDTEMADHRQNYGATSAPLAVGDLVISGHSGGDEGVRGFLAAFDQETGKEAWRFWTVPKPGEPYSETWQGPAIEHGCAATWLTGTYDPESDTLYWPTGNPCPDYNGDVRKGDNLFSDSILALDRKTGRRKWHYQYTPHDLWDWDAQQPPVLVDTGWQGKPRKLLLHANRNGFFYVLDRTSGELLRAGPFVKKLTWASRIGEDGRPVLNPGQTPDAAGVRVCPAVEGATNWFSTSFHPGTGLYYVQSLEKCNIFLKTPGQWEAGKSYYDGATRRVRDERGQKVLRAIDISTGKIAWEFPQTGPANSWGGVLSTAGGLVFFGEDSGNFTAADASSGRPLWRFPANVLWKSSPMTYSFDGRQYVAVAAGPNVVAFALPSEDGR